MFPFSESSWVEVVCDVPPESRFDKDRLSVQTAMRGPVRSMSADDEPSVSEARSNAALSLNLPKRVFKA
jgi:hypothetical protein